MTNPSNISRYDKVLQTVEPFLIKMEKVELPTALIAMIAASVSALTLYILFILHGMAIITHHGIKHGITQTMWTVIGCSGITAVVSGGMRGLVFASRSVHSCLSRNRTIVQLNLN
jgi:hypothetical protein